MRQGSVGVLFSDASTQSPHREQKRREVHAKAGHQERMVGVPHTLHVLKVMRKNTAGLTYQQSDKRTGIDPDKPGATHDMRVCLLVLTGPVAGPRTCRGVEEGGK